MKVNQQSIIRSHVLGFFSYKKQCQADIRSSLFLSLYSCITHWWLADIIVSAGNVLGSILKEKEHSEMTIAWYRIVIQIYIYLFIMNTQLSSPFPANFFFFFFWSCCMARELVVPQPGIEPISAVEVWNSNHWTAREVPSFPQFWSGCVLGHSSGSTGVIGNYWLSPSADSHSLH